MTLQAKLVDHVVDGVAVVTIGFCAYYGVADASVVTSISTIALGKRALGRTDK